jgi:hypothetical protein
VMAWMNGHGVVQRRRKTMLATYPETSPNMV